MGVVNLKLSNLQIESVSSASSNIEKYVLEGKTFIDGTFEDEASIKTGTLKSKNQDDLIKTLNQNLSFVIPEGNYVDEYSIKIPSVKNYTNGGTANANTIFKGYTAFVNGIKITGTGKVASLNSVNTSSDYTSIVVTWNYPSNSFINGVAVCCKEGGYETSNPYNSQKYIGAGTRCTISNLKQNTTYYISFFPYCFINNSYQWYAPNGNTVASYTTAVKTKKKSYSCGNCDSCANRSCHDCSLCSCNSNSPCGNVIYSR